MDKVELSPELPYSPDTTSHVLVYIVRGELRWTADTPSDSSHLHMNEMLFLPQHSQRTLHALTPTELIVFSIDSFQALEQENTFVPTAESSPYVSLSSPSELILTFRPPLVQWFSSVSQLLDNVMLSPYLQRLKCMELYALLHGVLQSPLFSAHLRGEQPSPHEEFRQRVLRLAPVAPNVHALAQGMGMSRAHFHRLFLAAFGLPPYQWLLQQKAERVRYYLLHTADPLKVVAQDLGFGSHSNLNAFCIKYFGKTAKALQLEHKGMG